MLFVSGIATGVLAAILLAALALPLVTRKAGGSHDWIAELVKEVHTVGVHASELVDAAHEARGLYGKVMTVQHGLTADVRNHLATLAAQATPGPAKAVQEAAPTVEQHIAAAKQAVTEAVKLMSDKTPEELAHLAAKAAPDIAVLAAEIPKGI